MSFSVTRIETTILEHPWRRERVVISNCGLHDVSRHLMVRVHGKEGVCGYGEAATLSIWSGETAETAQWVVEHLFAPKLVGTPWDHPQEALAVMDMLAVGNPFAKAAVDTALWDLWGHQEGVAATRLFADREPVAWVPTRGTIGAKPLQETIREAEEYWNLGIRTLKFKVGVRGLEDVPRLRAVRERLGEAPIFTVDANGAWKSAEEAVRAIEALLPVRIALVEQPTPRDRIGVMAQVRRRVPAPILADESIFTSDQLAEALDEDAFDLLSVYPGKNGGFTRSLEMAQIAHRAGKPCIIGGNVESDLGQGATLALAAALSAFPVEEFAGDFPSSLFYEASSIKDPPLLKNGRLEVPRGLGFGVEPRVFLTEP
jgi:muconate cycloisomerase